MKLSLTSRQLRIVLLTCLLGGQAICTHAQDGNSPSDDALESKMGSAATGQAFEFPPLTSDDPKDMCVYFHKKGAAELQASLYDDAIADLRRALALDHGSATPDLWCDSWGMQNELSIAYASNGDFPTRIEFLKEVLPRWQGRNPRVEFYVWTHLNESYRALARIKDSESSLQQLTDRFKAIRINGNGQNNVNNLYYRAAAENQELLGNFAEGERLRRVALDYALAYAKFFQSAAARESRNAMVAYRNVSGERRSLASNLVRQGKLAEAYYWAMEAMNPVNGIDSINSVQKSFLLDILGDIAVLRGKPALAQGYATQSIDVLNAFHIRPDAPQLASRRQKLALVLEMQGRWPEALEVYNERDLGLRSRPGAAGLDHIDWSMALMRGGKPDKAVQMLTRMLRNQDRRVAANPLLVAELHGYMGAALARGGQTGPAQLEFEAALPLVLDHLRHDAQSEVSGYVDKFRIHLIIDAYLDYLAGLARDQRTLPGVDVAAEAFRIADIARGSSVQGALVGSAARASIADPRLAALAREEQGVSSQKQSLQDIMLRLASAPAASRLDKVIADMRAEIARLAERQSRLRREIAQDYPDYSQLIDPRPPLPSDIQRVLGDDEVCVSIYSNDTQSFVWTITREGLGFRTVPVNEVQVAQWVSTLRRSVDLTDGSVHRFAADAAWQIYGHLLRPDRALWGRRQSLDVIANGALGQIPPALLLTAPADASTGNDYGRLPWLIKDVAIAQQPSASSLWALRSLKAAAAKVQRAPFVGFGNPRFGADAPVLAEATRALQVRNLAVARVPDAMVQATSPAQGTSQAASQTAAQPAPQPTLSQAFAYLPQLPDTALELQEIAQVLQANPAQDLMLDTHASETEVKTRDLSRYRVIAFATHGLVPGEISGLDQPALALSNPALTGEKTNDGFLTLDEVLALKLNADWVILSACNTASAEGASDEALSGLGRGFFYAGARSLLVSNWSVESASARMLTTGIFEQQQAHPQMTRAEALRQSMLRVMTAQPAYGHPAFWAPFTLAGDGVAQ